MESQPQINEGYFRPNSLGLLANGLYINELLYFFFTAETVSLSTAPDYLAAANPPPSITVLDFLSLALLCCRLPALATRCLHH